MNKLKNDIIEKYSYKDYVVYIKETDDCYECYLQNEEYGIISFMFGVSKEQCFNKVHKYYTTIPIKNYVEENIENYITIYKEKYED